MYDSSENGSGREKGGRQGGVIKHKCVPWRTAFLYCALSAGCRGTEGSHLMGSIDGNQQETEQRNIVWNGYLRKDSEWVKGHFLPPQFWASWRQINSPGDIKQLWVAESHASPEKTSMWAYAGVFFFPSHSKICCILIFSSCPFAITAAQKIFHQCLGPESGIFLCPQNVLSSRGSCAWGTGSGSPGINERNGQVMRHRREIYIYTKTHKHAYVYTIDTSI